MRSFSESGADPCSRLLSRPVSGLPCCELGPHLVGSTRHEILAVGQRVLELAHRDELSRAGQSVGSYEVGEAIGLEVASESALAAGLVMGIMIIPFVSSLSDDVINAVPQAMRDGSYALGATKSETIKKVIIPAALPGIVGGILLAVSRAIGETMVVSIAAGAGSAFTFNPFKAAETMTGHIVRISGGDISYDSLDYDSLFAIGLLLFLMTLGLNIVSRILVRRFREEYE